MLFGPNFATATIRRRPVVGGVVRGEFANVFTTTAGWRPLQGATVVEFGLSQDETGLMLRVQDCAQNRSITHADRMTFLGGDWTIVSTNPPDRVTGSISIILKKSIGG